MDLKNLEFKVERIFHLAQTIREINSIDKDNYEDKE